MASTKRESPFTDEFQLKKARVDEWEPSSSSSSAPDSNLRVVLNPADCDIDFNVEEDGLRGSSLYEEGFAYCWSGARANIGIIRGKYCFGCKILSAQPVDMEDTPLDLQHVSRVGISRGDENVQNLGETLNSFGFGGTGKFSNAGKFPNYGENFGVGDTIICAVDLESFPMASIGFSKNGNWLGVATRFDAGQNGLGVVGSPVRRLHWESAVFPHVLLKNVIVRLQFSIGDGLNPVEGYKPWDAAILDGNAMLGPSFLKVDDCEVVMMVGLPASGKTTWAEKWANDNPEKRYVLLGTNLALDQMRVPGLLRKNNYDERFKLLMDRATNIFNTLLSRASKIPRNFIIDQTNVYKSARKRKLKPFADFIKIAAVVFPRAEELKIRSDKRSKEMGKEVPAEAVKEMLANYTLPMSKDMRMADEYFDQVWFVELGGEESHRVLDEMKRKLNEKPPLSLDTHKSSLPSCSSSSFQLTHKCPVQPYSGVPFQNPGNLSTSGAGGSYQRSYSSQPPLPGAPCGDHISAPPYGDTGRVYQNYGMDNGNYYAGGGAIHLSRGNNIAESNPVMSSLSYDSGLYRCANAPGGAWYHDQPAMAHPAAPQPATHVPYDSVRAPMLRPPLGSSPQAEIYPHYLSILSAPSVNLPMNVQQTYGNGGFPSDVQRFGVYPQLPPPPPPTPQVYYPSPPSNYPSPLQVDYLSPAPLPIQVDYPPPPPVDFARDVRGFYAPGPRPY